MLETILKTGRKIIPKKLFKAGQPVYHYSLALLGALIYRFPSRKIKVIAVTGTKGKSTVTELIAKILESAGNENAIGKKCLVASTSTIQFKIGNQTRRNLYKMSMPGRFFMQKFLHQAVKAGCEYAVLEVTSEGAKLFRHKFIDFNALVFTNISPEHIESHGSYERYLDAKLSYSRALAESNKFSKFIIVNADDKESERFLYLSGDAKKIKYSLTDAEPYEITDNDLQLTINRTKINSKLIGKFNIYNILAAVKTTLAFGVDMPTIKKAIEETSVIVGRMQKVISGNPKQNFDVFVDYAHTDASLESALSGLRLLPHGRIITVFGCGGDRDRTKRAPMGAVACALSDLAIITSDNPRGEEPLAIIDDIEKGVTDKYDNYEVLPDRADAIEKAVLQARKGDILLIAGKGHETYQILKDRTVPFSYAETAAAAIRKKLGL